MDWASFCMFRPYSSSMVARRFKYEMASYGVLVLVRDRIQGYLGGENILLDQLQHPLQASLLCDGADEININNDSDTHPHTDATIYTS